MENLLSADITGCTVKCTFWCVQPVVWRLRPSWLGLSSHIIMLFPVAVFNCNKVWVPLLPNNLCAVTCRYSIHLWDLNHPGTWESKGTYVYYTDFIMELAMLFLDLIHHIHMLVSCSKWTCVMSKNEKAYWAHSWIFFSSCLSPAIW